MTKGTKILHSALHYSDRKQAEIFFTKILELKLKKTFTLSKDLSNNIFKINEEVTVDVYSNDEACFEVFITKIKIEHGYEHICIEIDDKEEFIKRCRKYKIEPKIVKKGAKTLLFIKDFLGNLFEIKEKK